jgi:hypothetical protein
MRRWRDAMCTAPSNERDTDCGEPRLKRRARARWGIWAPGRLAPFKT